MPGTIHVYILRCADGSYYVGSTEDLQNAHNTGQGAKYTFLRRPVQLVYSESYDSLVEAVVRERQLKRWSHAKKHALIVGDTVRLKQLSKRVEGAKPAYLLTRMTGAVIARNNVLIPISPFV